MTKIYGKDDIVNLFDGDTALTDDGSVRFAGMDTAETLHVEKDGTAKANFSKRGYVAKDAVENLFAEGAYLESDGGDGGYGRSLGTLKDAQGKAVNLDMIESGLAAPTNYGNKGDQAQAELAGVMRKALGMTSTTNKSLQPYADSLKGEVWTPFTDAEFFGAENIQQTKDRRGLMKRAFTRGGNDVVASAGGFLNWVGDFTGNEELVEYGKDLTREASADSASAKRDIQDFSQVKSLEDGFTYAVETLGEMAPGLIFDVLTTVATAGAGAAQAVVRRAGIAAIKSGAKKGLIAGPIASGFIQSVGNMENTLEAHGEEVNTGSAFASGVAGGITNALPFLAALPRIGKAAGLGDEVIKGIGNRITDIMKTTGITGGAEGGASVTQEIIDKVIENKAIGEDTSLEDFTTREFVDNAIRAVLGGGVAGGVASSAGHGGQKVISEYNKAVEEDLASAFNAGVGGFEAEKSKMAPEGQMPTKNIDPNNLTIGDIVPDHEAATWAEQSAQGTKGTGITVDDIPNLSDIESNWNNVNRLATNDYGEPLPWSAFKANVDAFNSGLQFNEQITNGTIAEFVGDRLQNRKVQVRGKANGQQYKGRLLSLLGEIRFVKKGGELVSQEHLGFLSRGESTFYPDLQNLVSKKNVTDKELDDFIKEHRLYKVAGEARRLSFEPDGRAMYSELFGISEPKSPEQVEELRGKRLVKEGKTAVQKRADSPKAEKDPKEKVLQDKMKPVDGEFTVDTDLAEQEQSKELKKLKAKAGRAKARAKKVNVLFDRLKVVAKGKRSGNDTVAASNKEVRFAKEVRRDLAHLARSKTIGQALEIAKGYGISDLEASSLKNYKAEVRAQILEQGEANFTTGIKEGAPKARKVLKLGGRAKVKVERTVSDGSIASHESDMANLEKQKTTIHRKSKTRTAARKAKKPVNKVIMTLKEKRAQTVKVLKTLSAKAKVASDKAKKSLKADLNAQLKRKFERNTAILRAAKLEGDPTSAEVLRIVDDQIKTRTFTADLLEVVNEAAKLVEVRASQAGTFGNRTFRDEDGSETYDPENDTQGVLTEADKPLSEELINDRARRVTAVRSLFKLLRSNPDFKDVDMDSFESSMLAKNDLESALTEIPDRDVGKPALDLTFSEKESIQRGKQVRLVNAKVKRNLLKAIKEGDFGRFKKVLDNSKIVEDIMPIGTDMGISPAARILGMINRGYGLPEDKRVGVSVVFPDGQERYAFVDPAEVTAFGAAEMDGFDINNVRVGDKNFKANLARAFHAGLARIHEASTQGFDFTPQIHGLDGNTIVYRTDADSATDGVKGRVQKGYTLNSVTNSLQNSEAFDTNRRLPLSIEELDHLSDTHVPQLSREIKEISDEVRRLKLALSKLEKSNKAEAVPELKRVIAALENEQLELSTIFRAVDNLTKQHESLPVNDFGGRGKLAGDIRTLTTNSVEGEIIAQDKRESLGEIEGSEVDGRMMSSRDADSAGNIDQGQVRGRQKRIKPVVVDKTKGKFADRAVKPDVSNMETQDNTAYSASLKRIAKIRASSTVENLVGPLTRTAQTAKVPDESATFQPRPIGSTPTKDKQGNTIQDRQDSKTDADIRRGIEGKYKADFDLITEKRRQLKSSRKKADTTKQLRLITRDLADVTREERLLNAKVEAEVKSFYVDLERKAKDSNAKAASDRLAKRGVVPAGENPAKPPSWADDGETPSIFESDGGKALAKKGDGTTRTKRLDAEDQTKNPEQKARNEKRAVAHARRSPPSRIFRAISKIVNSARTQLEGINYTLAEALYTRSGKGNEDGSFERDRRLWSHSMRVKLAEIIPNKAEVIQRAFEDAQKDSPETSYGRALKVFVSEHNAKIRAINPDYKGEGLPIVLDTIAIDGDRKGFKEILRKHKIENVEEFVNDMFAGHGIADYSINHGAGRPKGVRRKNNELAKAYKDLAEAGFVDNDAPSVLNRFIESSTSYASWSKIFGAKDSTGKFQENAFFDYLMDKTDPTERGDVLKIVEAITHTMEPAPHWLNVFNSTAFAFHAATILWFSGVASLPEAASIAARSRGDVDGLGSDLRGVFNKTKRAEAAKLVSEFETFTAGMQRHALHRLYGDGDLSAGKASQWVSEKVFFLNGQELLLEGMYHFATQTGHRFVEEHVPRAISGDEYSKRALSELGVSIDDAKAYVEYKGVEKSKVEGDSGHYKLGSKAAESSAKKRLPESIKRAVQLFVDESISNPHVSQMPTWMTDPRFQVLATLKKFFYAFWENNHRQIYSETKARGAKPEALLPLAMALTFAIPLAAVSEYLRELVKYPFGRGVGNEKTLGDMFTGSLLATGGLGPIQNAQSAYEQTSYGRNFAVSLAGPTPSLAFDILKGDAKASRFIPIVSQQPELRQMVDEKVRSIVSD